MAHRQREGPHHGREEGRGRGEQLRVRRVRGAAGGEEVHKADLVGRPGDEAERAVPAARRVGINLYFCVAAVVVYSLLFIFCKRVRARRALL
jgi:hypothetical protein